MEIEEYEKFECDLNVENRKFRIAKSLQIFDRANAHRFLSFSIIRTIVT